MQNPEEVFISVWRQALIDGAKTIQIADATFPVRTTAKRKLKQVDFQLDGREIRALEQNPDTKSNWAALARKGQKIMQFIESGKYIGVVADGKFHSFAKR